MFGLLLLWSSQWRGGNTHRLQLPSTHIFISRFVPYLLLLLCLSLFVAQFCMFCCSLLSKRQCTLLSAFNPSRYSVSSLFCLFSLCRSCRNLLQRRSSITCCAVLLLFVLFVLFRMSFSASVLPVFIHVAVYCLQTCSRRRNSASRSGSKRSGLFVLSCNSLSVSH